MCDNDKGHSERKMKIVAIKYECIVETSTAYKHEDMKKNSQMFFFKFDICTNTHVYFSLRSSQFETPRIVCYIMYKYDHFISSRRYLSYRIRVYVYIFRLRDSFLYEKSTQILHDRWLLNIVQRILFTPKNCCFLLNQILSHSVLYNRNYVRYYLSNNCLMIWRYLGIIMNS